MAKKIFLKKKIYIYIYIPPKTHLLFMYFSMGKITYFSDFKNQNQNHPKTVIFKIKIRSPERSDFDQNHSNHLKIRSDFQNHFKITSKSLSKYIIPKTEYVL